MCFSNNIRLLAGKSRMAQMTLILRVTTEGKDCQLYALDAGAYLTDHTAAGFSCLRTDTRYTSHSAAIIPNTDNIWTKAEPPIQP
jgi:hypothetical protein